MASTPTSVRGSSTPTSLRGLHCPNGHPVTQLRTSERFFRGRTGLRVKQCTLCREVIDRDSPRWKCAHHLCRYHYCQGCYQQSMLQAAEDLDIGGQGAEAARQTVVIMPILANLAGEHTDSESDDDDDATEWSPGLGRCLARCWPGWGSETANGDESHRKLVSPEDTPEREVLRDVEVEVSGKQVAAPAIGGLTLNEPHSRFLLPLEVVLFEPSEKEIGTPYEPGKPGKRFIFLNTKLSKAEQTGLQALHAALAAERSVTAEGDSEFPPFVGLHALRILQQAKFDTKKAVNIMLTHLDMRVKHLPVFEEELLRNLKTGFIYWHGRDRKCRPILVWRLARMEAIDRDTAVKLVIFVLEYGIRYALVPGRVENWILIVDLEDVGAGVATSSANREVSKKCAILLEQVYCGRNVTTKIMNSPRMVKSIANSFIPTDKKDKVQFVGDAEIQTTMLGLAEPHQLEQRYGGTAPNLAPEETYPYHFFPNASGEAQAGNTGESLHNVTDRAFHEGCLWDESSTTRKAAWVDSLQGQSLTSAAVRDLESMGIQNIKPCVDKESWLRLIKRQK